MGRRPYNLGARAASVAATRRRILDAATAEFADQGVEATSMAAVARRADVAAGTVLYHFPTPEDLVDAVVETWRSDMQMPSVADIDPAAPLVERFAALVALLFGLFERSEWAYEIWRHSPDHPSFVRAAEGFYEVVGQMMAAALGDLAADPEAMLVTSVIVDPGFRGTLVSRGLSSERAIEVATELGVAWLLQRS
jgi:AcrR family transcriptional regulator